MADMHREGWGGGGGGGVGVVEAPTYLDAEMCALTADVGRGRFAFGTAVPTRSTFVIRPATAGVCSECSMVVARW